MTEERKVRAGATVEESLAARLQRQKEATEALRGLGWESDLAVSREGRKLLKLETP